MQSTFVLLLVCSISFTANAQQPIDSAYFKALNYFNNKQSETPTAVLLLMHYFQPKYEFEFTFDIAKILEERFAKTDIPEQPFIKFFKPDAFIKPEDWKYIRSSNDSITLLALYCQSMNIKPDEFCKQIQTHAQKHGYYLNRSIFSLYILQRNECLKSNSGIYKKTKASLQTEFKIYLQEYPSGDKLYESIAFADLIGVPQKLSESYIRAIISEQLPSGAWSTSSKTMKPNDHSTFLAMMLLKSRMKNMKK
jgi:hypothetical protein